MISLIETLDYERTSQFFLTIEASDGGVCYVIVRYFPGVISLIEPLDYERTSQFFLTIEASDGGVPRLTATTVVKLNVTDINDNSPTFAMPVYSATLREDVRLQHSVIQVGRESLFHFYSDEQSLKHSLLFVMVVKLSEDALIIIIVIIIIECLPITLFHFNGYSTFPSCVILG